MGRNEGGNMYCENCGSKIEADERFCSNCGYSIQKLKRRKNNKKAVIILVVMALVIIPALGISGVKILYPWLKYQKAERLLEQYRYQEALDEFLELGDYKDARERVGKFWIRIKREENEEGIRTYDYEFDDRGNIVKQVLTDEEGKIKIEESKFNKQNLVISKMIYNQTDGQKILDSQETYEYDADGNLEKYTIMHENEEVSKTVYEYEYDSRGNRTKEESISYHDGVEAKETMYVTEYKYNAENKVISILSMAYCESSYEELKYDSEGSKVKVFLYSDSSKETLISETEYEYEGNLLKSSTRKYGQGKAEDVEYEYDSYGKMIRYMVNYIDIENPEKNDSLVITYNRSDTYRECAETIIKSEYNGKKQTKYENTVYAVVGYGEQRYQSGSDSLKILIDIGKVK